MGKQFRGTIAWFRATSGRGMIDEDSGRKYFFDGNLASDLHPEPGLRVEFTVARVDGGAEEATQLRHAAGQRTVREVEPTKQVRKARKPAPRKQNQAPRRAGKTAPARRPAGAMRDGAMVSHPKHGPGYVVATTEHLVSVEFLSGERKTFKPAALRDIGGPDAPKAPRPQQRRPRVSPTDEGEDRVIRRRKEEDE